MQSFPRPLLALMALVLWGCQATAPSPYPAPEGAAPAAARAPEMGQPAPDFNLISDNDMRLTLSSLRGRWVVLYFYPPADTPECPCNATEFTKLLRGLPSLPTTVLGISPDAPSTHRLAKAQYKISGLTLLTDPPPQRTMTSYGTWLRTRNGTTTTDYVYRSTFLIDPAGRIAYRWCRVVSPAHVEEIRQKLVELSTRYLGGATP